jgi:hypothetical protein
MLSAKESGAGNGSRDIPRGPFVFGEPWRKGFFLIESGAYTLLWPQKCDRETI